MFSSVAVRVLGGLRQCLACGLLAFGIGCPLASPHLAQAEEWQASLYNEGLPTHLVAVDKKRQTFMFFEKKSPLKLKYTYPCTTGQLTGDKQSLNDLRTPEGIYFVEYKIASGLDFKEYGGIAYTLNYPNPVDRLRGKTGHGIWIHSKGFGIEPLATRGCVAIGLKEIDEVGPQLTPGTAVVLAEKMDETAQPRSDTGTAQELRRLMQNWSNAWASRSVKMFDYYDPDAYSKAMTENFVAFRQNKERLFKSLQFIKIFNRKINVLEGPGYWVTWSEQLYTASNLSTEGVRRLYWQRGKDQKFRIVGMEWAPRDLGMRADFQKGQLVAEAPLQQVSDASSEAPQPPRLDMPEAAPEKTAPVAMTVPQPSQDKTAQAATAKPGQGEKLVAANDPLVPKRGSTPPPAEVNWGARPSMEEAARTEAEAAQKNAAAKAAEQAAPQTPAALAASQLPPPASVQAPVQAPATAQVAGQMTAQPVAQAAASTPASAPAPLALTPDVVAGLEKAVKAWNADFASRSMDIASLYDQARFNREAGTPRGYSYNSTMREFERRFAAPWLRLISRKPKFELQGTLAVSHVEQLVVTPNAMEQGVRSFWWNRDDKGDFRIVATQFRPDELGLAADYLDQVSDDVSAMVEKWRKAWEAGRIEEYIEYYADDAIQQGRWGAKNIQKQKEQLWQRVKPTLVQITGLRLVADKQGIRADMNQVYADSSGHTDRGTKTLLLRFDGKNWRIAREDWALLGAPVEPVGTVQ
ncbi:MAG: L,D-transpeptidase family protein [Desulfovibrio sp.]|uniref:L,D-transpeptidase Cds6 family protein n=1 Tax=Desulfovibrio sp. TaxID=885 RepID=UPI00135D678A|nr:L,D-transpeptidase family protein [Desulfovibrio sp.]MTJ92142.1 L,D-transpeptidase family protein [Desulfovibrio sp.]